MLFLCHCADWLRFAALPFSCTATQRDSNSNYKALSLRHSSHPFRISFTRTCEHAHTHTNKTKIFFASCVVYGRKSCKKHTKIRPKNADKVMSMQLVNVLVIKSAINKITQWQRLKRKTTRNLISDGSDVHLTLNSRR